MTVLLDEPTRGLHPREVDALAGALTDLRDAGNTVVVVDHDPRLIGRADHLLVLGPGAGREGGRLLADGPASVVRRSGRADVQAVLAAPLPDRVSGPRRPALGAMVVRRPTANNLAGNDITIPLGVLVAVMGPPRGRRRFSRWSAAAGPDMSAATVGRAARPG